MWFRNRLVNPVVRWLLRSPLHPVLSRSLLILSYQGHKTGRWQSLPCMYARDGQDLYVVPGQPDRKVWWRNLRQPTPVRLRLQGRDLEGSATASSDPEAVAAGLRRYVARYPKAAKPLGVRLETNGTVTASRPLIVVAIHLIDPTRSTTAARPPARRAAASPPTPSSEALVNQANTRRGRPPWGRADDVATAGSRP